MGKRKSMDDRIKNLLREGPLVALYFIAGINLLKQQIDDMTDEDVAKMFDNLLNSQRVRNNVEDIYNKLNYPKDE
ncbi:MAG: hypothetical protein RR471_08045 [Bacteroides sp.]